MASGLEGVAAAGTILNHTDPNNGTVWVCRQVLLSLAAIMVPEALSRCCGRAKRLEQAVAVAIQWVRPGRLLPLTVEIMAAPLLDAVGNDVRCIHSGLRCRARWQQKTGE